MALCIVAPEVNTSSTSTERSNLPPIDEKTTRPRRDRRDSVGKRPGQFVIDAIHEPLNKLAAEVDAAGFYDSDYMGEE